MIGGAVTNTIEGMRDRVARGLLRTRIHPNTLTTIGFLLNLPVGCLIATGRFVSGAAMLIIAGIFDLLDGAVARRGNRMTRFGGIYDSTVDRLSDMVLYGGAAWYFHRMGPAGELSMVVSLAALAFALMISYTRARAECEIESCAVGFAERPERIIILTAALFLGNLEAGVWVLLVVALITFIHRVWYSWYAANGRPFPRTLDILFLEFPRGSAGFDAVFAVILLVLLFARDGG